MRVSPVKYAKPTTEPLLLMPHAWLNVPPRVPRSESGKWLPARRRGRFIASAAKTHVCQSPHWSSELHPDNKDALESRVVRAAEDALTHHQYVSSIDILTGMGPLALTNLEAWRKGPHRFSRTGYPLAGFFQL